MGLFNRLIADAGVERGVGLLKQMKPPKGIDDVEWQVIRDKLGKGNTELVDAMSFGGPSSNWEHGGIATPTDALKTITDRDPTSVNPPISANPDKSIIYHSHPHTLDAESGEQFPAALSLGDLGVLLKGSGGAKADRGITSLDPLGGFAYAIRNEKLPNIKPVTWHQMQIDARAAAMKSLSEASSPNWMRSGVEASGRPRSRFDPPTDATSDALAATLGVGRALNRANVLTEFGNLPAGEAQLAGAAMLEPAVEASAQAAEEIVSNWLKMSGYDSGTIKAIIAALVSSGGLMAAVSEIEDTEADV